MRNRHSLAGLALAAASLACTLSPNTVTSPPAEPTTGPATELQVLPSSTTLPTPQPTDLPTPTPTLEDALARPKKELVNCRFGPGTVYVIIGELKENQAGRIAGKNSDASWYYIHDPGNPDGFCWVAAEVVDIEGDTESLPVVEPPASSVTDVMLVVEPNRILVTCDKFPQVVYMTGHITTDGPGLVTYRWEASTGAASVENTIAFEEAGTQTIQEYYPIGSANDYWIILHVLSPNDKSEQVNFTASCTP